MIYTMGYDDAESRGETISVSGMATGSAIFIEIGLRFASPRPLYARLDTHCSYVCTMMKCIKRKQDIHTDPAGGFLPEQKIITKFC